MGVAVSCERYESAKRCLAGLGEHPIWQNAGLVASTWATEATAMLIKNPKSEPGRDQLIHMIAFSAIGHDGQHTSAWPVSLSFSFAAISATRCPTSVHERGGGSAAD
jgi:hypothetical protein